ncbi:DJ-1/PfpI family protein, partial [Plesiomonas shigelloides]|uniref:DJ-1/PfpI family protein n=2 Tax=Plesiomonas shigelloides TaxID=703 RepID=UPI003CC76508
RAPLCPLIKCYVHGGTMNIGIYIYDGAEVLDFAGPFEVFSTAKRLGASEWNIFLIAEALTTVTARGGFNVVPKYSLDDHPKIDVLIIAGGIHREEMLNSNVIAWVKSVNEQAMYVASVCTGVFILANTGLLSGLPVTTHWEDMPQLKQEFSDLAVLENVRWTKSGKYITSGGISAGIDMSLYLISLLHSTSLAELVAHQMEYSWQKCT